MMQSQPVFGAPDRSVKKRPVGRPRMSDAEKRARGTFEPGRARDEPETAVGVLEVEEASPRDYVGIAEQYVRDVLDGTIASCSWVKLACERHELDRQQVDWLYVWSDELATEACAFIEHLPHVEGKWKTGTLTLEPCQVFWVTSLFGWRHRAEPWRRRFTAFYLELARKGAKSTLMAAIAFFHLLREQEPGAKVFCGATTGTQARVVFGIMQQMARTSRWLRDQGVEVLANAIMTRDGVCKPINAKASTQDGLNPSCIVLDESHAQKPGLYDVLDSAQGSRSNPLMLAPTTAGYDLLSVGYALRTHLTKVLQRVFPAEHLFGLIYTLDEKDDWRDEPVWIKANPMIGITPLLDRMRTKCTGAQQDPGREGEFRVKNCSQWLQSALGWLNMLRWDACADPTIRLEQFLGQPCWIGVDNALRDDLSAVALVFERDGLLYAFVRMYLPRDVVELRARKVPEYLRWVIDGILIMTEGPLTDNAVIEADIRGFCKQFQVQAIVFDQFGSVDISGRLEKDGFPAIVQPKNAKTFTGPAVELETRVNHGLFRHDGNSCLKWQASNCSVSRRVDGSLLPKKESAESPNKVDAIDAILQAIGALLRKPAQPEFRMLVLGGGR